MFQSIDVDRIVMEHYQATTTPRGLASDNMSTPSGNKCNFNGLEENNLPEEISVLCSHHSKVGRRPRSTYHLCSVLTKPFQLVISLVLLFS
jgi:bloom syndrome protein